jgi:hypothetical protein
MNAVLKPYEVHPAFASILRTMCPPAARPPTYDALASGLCEACKELEKNARDAFVVNGDPVTQEAFEDVWIAEDRMSYVLWHRLSAMAEKATQGVKS